MDVLVGEQDISSGVELGGDLTARFVRTWRKKCKGNDDFWYQRSRLVAREFNKLCVRDDLYSPASNHIVERLVPASCLSNIFSKNFFWALSISQMLIYRFLKKFLGVFPFWIMKLILDWSSTSVCLDRQSKVV